MLTIAQIGVGRWGKNILRNLSNLSEINLKYVCERDKNQQYTLKSVYPRLNFISDSEIIFDDPDIQALVITTPVTSHFSLAKSALEAGKHIFVEKPLVLEMEQLLILEKLAQSKNLIVMEGHLLLYHKAILKMAELIKNNTIGKLHHLYFRRTNLGAIRLK